MGRVRRLIPLALVCAALAGAAACAHVQAAALPGPNPLDVPAPPPRVVVPPSVDVVDPPAPPPPATPAPVTPARPHDAVAPVRTPPDKPPVSDPPATVASPPEAQALTLETTSDVTSLENQTKSLLASAQRDLNRVDARALSADAQAQYHAAQGFVKQALTALKEKNLTYARNMAEKAAALAGQLPKTGPIRPTVP
jgi:hypothetical protein